MDCDLFLYANCGCGFVDCGLWDLCGYRSKITWLTAAFARLKWPDEAEAPDCKISDKERSWIADKR